MSYENKEHSNILEARYDSFIFVVSYFLSLGKPLTESRAVFIKSTIDSLFCRNPGNAAFERQYISLPKEIVMNCPWMAANEEIISFMEKSRKTLSIAEAVFRGGDIPRSGHYTLPPCNPRTAAENKANLLNFEEETFRYIKKYLVKNLSDRKKTDFTDEFKAESNYACGDNTLTTLSISGDKIIFSVAGEIPLIGDEDILQFHDQFTHKQTEQKAPGNMADLSFIEDMFRQCIKKGLLNAHVYTDLFNNKAINRDDVSDAILVISEGFCEFIKDNNNLERSLPEFVISCVYIIRSQKNLDVARRDIFDECKRIKQAFNDINQGLLMIKSKTVNWQG